MSAIQNKIDEINGTSCLTSGEFEMKFHGILEKSIRFIERNQIYDVNLWKKFVDQFRIHSDDDLGWRCEYWGKMMRGACMIIGYTKDDGFYRLIENSVRDMLTAQDELGRISAYPVEKEFDGWDLWGRKYVMLGMQYFLEICRDNELEQKIIVALCRHADYIIEHIGSGDGKKEICKASRHWQGLNSCSILEPMIRLYRMTGDKKYLHFGEYIISTGFIEGGNLIELAHKNKLAPYEYPVVKAYEMMSCFEGLLHYYRLTGSEKHRTALINFGKRIIDSELSVIGCSGCTHELFDNTALKQTQTGYKGIIQETCVTVTWMRLAEGLLELTGDVSYADAIERSFYNAYLGSFNTYRVPFSRYPQMNDVPQIMPFDSYSPLTADTRGRQIGGYQLFPDGSFYGCCACIAAAGSGIMPRFAALKSTNGLVISFYEEAEIRAKTPTGKEININIQTEYPLNGRVNFTLDLAESESFEIALRIPKWCRKATLRVNEEESRAYSGYAPISRTWQDGDRITLDMPMNIEKIFPPKEALNSDAFAAYRRGAIVLAADARLADPYSAIEMPCDESGFVEGKVVPCPEIPDAEICVEMKKTDGEAVRLINYSSAGKTWSADSACAAWLHRIKADC